jgi:hypothetical protein
MRSSTRHRRRILAAVVLVCVAGIVTWSWMQRGPRGVIHLVVPVDADHGIFLYQELGDDDMSVVMRHRDGSVLWTASTTQASLRPQVTVIPHADRVVVRTSPLREAARFEAFTLTDGTPSWTWENPEPLRNATGEYIWEQPPASVPRGRLSPYLLAFFGEGALVVQLDPVSGTELGRGELDRVNYGFLHADDNVLVHPEWGGLIEVKPSEQGPEVRAIDDAVCRVAGGWILATEHGHELAEPGEEFEAIPVSGLAERVFGPACGSRAGTLIVVEDHPSGTSFAALLGGEDFALDRRIDLVEFRGNLFNRWYVDSQFATELPRYVFLLGADVVVALDLDDARVAWRSARDADLLHYKLFKADGHVYLAGLGNVARLDPDSGEIAAAVRYPRTRHDVQPFHVRAGRLWLASADSFVVLDAASLEVVSSHGDLSVEPATDEFRAWLGRDS